MRVYFDYNATTPPSPEVVDRVAAATRDLFGNPSSVHHFGQQAKAVLDDARSAVASLIACDPSEVIFTAGGTEADNLALRGVAEALEPSGRRHLIASAIENEAVLNTLKALARRIQGELAGAEIAHLKMTLSPDSGLADVAVINLVRSDRYPRVLECKYRRQPHRRISVVEQHGRDGRGRPPAERARDAGHQPERAHRRRPAYVHRR